MKPSILKSGRVTAMGAMSGTSLDGVDAAVIVTDGLQIFEFGPSDYRAYTQAEQQILRAALGHWDGAAVDAARRVVEQVHCAVLGGFEGIDLVGFHGQTLAHAPRTKGTLQVGDGAWLSSALNTPVVWDFRTADVEFGGEGAPLAPFFHFACAKYIGATEPIAFLNLGGVGNLTYVDPTYERPETPGALLAFDTGPANAPINDLIQSRLGQPIDENGQIAAGGRSNRGKIEQFLADPFFQKIPPKSLDRNDFSESLSLVSDLNNADAAASLTAMCAAAVAVGMGHCPMPPCQVLVAGGGRHNPVLMSMLKAALGCPVVPVEEVGLDGDMLEAQAFAFLATRIARGLPTSCPTTTGVRAAIGGGIVSYPQDTSVTENLIN
ncbi:MAG: anhydro-N-acetylmuramic acid kinase [Roseobacter sp.]